MNTITVAEFRWHDHRVDVAESAESAWQWRLTWTYGSLNWTHVEEFHHAYLAFARLAVLAFAIEHNSWLVHAGDESSLELFRLIVDRLVNQTVREDYPLNHGATDRPHRYPPLEA